MPRSVTKWHTEGHGKGREGVWRVYGGGKVGERWGKGGGPGPSRRPSSVPFWPTTPFLFQMSTSNRYPSNPFPPLTSPATTCPTLPAAAPTAPDHRGTQTHESAIFRLLASSRTLRASFTISGRSASRFVSSDGRLFTSLFMQHQQLLSIPFPRGRPRSTTQRRGKLGAPGEAGSSVRWSKSK